MSLVGYVLCWTVHVRSFDCDLCHQFFLKVEEAEWAVEVLKSTGKPSVITMCIGPLGDSNNISPGECAVRLARAGNINLVL